MTKYRFKLFNCTLCLWLELPVFAAPLGDSTSPDSTDQWYIGLGGGVSFLQPNPLQPCIDPVDDQDTHASVFIGRGIRANGIKLRSMAGSAPVASNATPAGRALNNRIEVLEYR